MINPPEVPASLLLSGVFDISMLNSLPGIIISAPKDGNELRDLLYTGIISNKAFSIRYPKENCNEYEPETLPKLIDIGKWEYLSKGGGIAIFAVGSMVKKCQNVLDNELLKDATLVNARFIKPMDLNILEEIRKNHKYVFTFEEGSEIGGFGSNILNYYSKNNSKLKVFTKGIEDHFVEHGTRDELLEITNLDEKGIVRFINNSISDNEDT